MNWRQFAAGGLLALLVIVGSGCVALVAGAAAGGAVSYVNNELHATEPASLDRVWSAVKAAAQEVQYVKVSEQQDALNAVWKGRNALDQPVVVELKRVAEKSTQIKIRVGTVTTSQNRAAAQLLYDKMQARL
jgi:RNA-binding protein YhbY